MASKIIKKTSVPYILDVEKQAMKILQEKQNKEELIREMLEEYATKYAKSVVRA